MVRIAGVGVRRIPAAVLGPAGQGGLGAARAAAVYNFHGGAAGYIVIDPQRVAAQKADTAMGGLAP